MITEINNNPYLTDEQFRHISTLFLSERDENKKAWLTKSKLEKYLTDPVDWVERYIFKHRTPDTPTILKGKHLHQFCQFLTICKKTPNEIMAEFVKKPADIKFNTIKGKEWKKEQIEKGLKILDDKEYIFISKLIKNFFSCPYILKMTEAKLEYEKELSDPETMVFGIVDMIDIKNKIIYEIKTSSDENIFKKFTYYKEKQVGYQALIYKQIAKAQFGEDFDFKYLIIQTVSPYHVFMYPNTPKQIENFNMNIHRCNEFLSADTDNYFTFYGRLVDLLGFDPITSNKKPEDFSIQDSIDITLKLKKDPFFSKIFEEQILEFNYWNMQNMKEGGVKCNQ